MHTLLERWALQAMRHYCMSQQVWAAQALESFDAVVQATEGFRSRAGQRLMAQQVARTFSSATLGKVDEESGEAAPTRSIAVIQAGTGVGKSLAYCAPAIALALSLSLIHI